MRSSLTWALVIATYNRRDMLVRALPLALKQDPPPLEVIVVDASPDWEVTRAECETIVAGFPNVRFVYEKAKAASSARQRNQAVDLSTADIVFIFDDDTFMFPDCARHILDVYAADERILGVNTSVEGVPPEGAQLDEQIRREAPSEGVHLGGESIAAKVKRVAWREVLLMGVEKAFVPYDGDYPTHPEVPIPEQAELEILFSGYNMTMRRSVFKHERFDDQMLRYSPGEDLDLSYRVSRRGPLLRAKLAFVYHHGSATARMKRFQVTALNNLNQAFWVGRHGNERAKAQLAVRVARRLLAEAIKDASQRRLDFPQLRGVFLVARHLPQLLLSDDQKRTRLHTELQAELLG